jgi:hypothetical protein
LCLVMWKSNFMQLKNSVVIASGRDIRVVAERAISF